MVGIFRKKKTKKEIFISKNLGLWHERGQSDQEHFHLILNLFNEFILYENLIHPTTGVYRSMCTKFQVCKRD